MLISLYQVLIKNVVLETLFFQSAAPLTKFLILYNFFTIYITDVWMRRNKGITEDIFSLLLQFDFNHFLCALTAGLSWKVHHDRNVVGLVTYVGKKSLGNYRLQETERMEWMNEWTNEWINERMNKWIIKFQRCQVPRVYCWLFIGFLCSVAYKAETLLGLSAKKKGCVTFKLP